MTNAYRLPLPVVYVDTPVQWRYLHHWHDLKEGPAASDEILDELGAQGWELVAAFTVGKKLCYLFKSQA